MTARSSRWRLPVRAIRGQQGYTLVEMLVAMSIVMFIVLGGMSLLKASGGAVTTSTQLQDVNEEARQAINRMSRDLRQAKVIVTAVNPDGTAFDPTHIVAIRFKADFDGDQCIGGVALPNRTIATGCLPYNASNPEDVSYCFAPVAGAAGQLYVIDNQATGVTPVIPTSTTCQGGQPILAGNVSGFTLEYRSNEYQYDLHPSDGITTWLELDEGGGVNSNNNGRLDVELADIDTVVLTLRMRTPEGHLQDYRTQVDLRNESQ
jgi:prepilin-type N-terminal cleavage/methylation domain-containing protein